MCGPQVLGFLGLGGGATAAGAAAGAATAGAFGGLGTLISVGGALIQGVSGMQAGRAQAAALEQQAQDQARLTAQEDQRKRREYLTAIATQRAELAARGVSLDSPTAIALGQSAAREMSFDSQAIRSGGVARQQELSAEARMARAQGMTSLLQGTFSAAGSVLRGNPDLWPGFNRKSSGGYA